VPALEPDQRLDTVLDLLLRSDVEGLPVTSPGGSITGWVSHRDVLEAYHRLLMSERTGRTRGPGGPRVAAPASLR
jgi:CBS domain-containing protein